MNTQIALQPDMSQQKIDLIKQTVAKGATDLELELFLHACKRTGLDPLMKQIYAIKRLNRKTNKEEMSIQTGIDGYRLIADRTGQYAGSDEPTYTVGNDGFPDVASVVVYKMVGSVRCPFGASARWNEYCQDASPMWKKMPFLMLGKCAEALALRKAFPAELSGVYTHEEMMQADNEPDLTTHEVAAKHATDLKAVQAKLHAAKVPLGAPIHHGQALTSVPPAIVDHGVTTFMATSFLWQIGKEYNGKRVENIPLEYLTWYVTNGKNADHVEAAKAELARETAADGAGAPEMPNGVALDALGTTQQASDALPHSLLPEYLDQIGLSQSVSECSKTLNAALKDPTLTVFDTTQLQDAGKAKILVLRGAK